MHLSRSMALGVSPVLHLVTISWWVDIDAIWAVLVQDLHWSWFCVEFVFLLGNYVTYVVLALVSCEAKMERLYLHCLPNSISPGLKLCLTSVTLYSWIQFLSYLLWLVLVGLAAFQLYFVLQWWVYFLVCHMACSFKSSAVVSISGSDPNMSLSAVLKPCLHSHLYLSNVQFCCFFQCHSLLWLQSWFQGFLYSTDFASILEFSLYQKFLLHHYRSEMSFPYDFPHNQ